MSFIYDDKNLINELLKSALEFEKKFSKQGQAAPPTNLDSAYTAQTNNFNSLLQLVNNLESRVGNPNDVPEVSHGGAVGAKARLDSKDLINLGSLVQFLASNAITIDNQRIAYLQSADEEAPEGYKYLKLEPGPGAITNPNRGGIRQVSFVNTELFSSYLQSLIASLSKNPNQATSLFLKHIIEESNSQLGTSLSMQGGPQSKDQSGTQSNQQSGEQPDIQHSIATVIESLPFDSDFIDFEKINEFLVSYMRVVQMAQRGGQIFTAIQNAQNAINKVVAMTQNNDTRISTNIGYYDLAQMLKPPYGTNYLTFINLIQSVIQATYTVIADFYANWVRDPAKHRELIIDPKQKQAVEEQILGNNSYYQRNMVTLAEWANDKDRVIKFV